YGVAAGAKITEEVVLGASYTLSTFNDDDFGGVDVPSQHQVGATAAYEVLVPAEGSVPELSICPTAGLSYLTWDELSAFSVPLGVSLGTAIPISGGAATLNPFAMPQLVWSRASAEGFDAESDTDFGYTVGLNAIFGNLFGGVGA